MYGLVAKIPNEGPQCLIPEVAFHPDSSRFAVTYLGKDEVRIYDSADFSVLAIYRDAVSQLDKPHGVLLTDNHMIVINRHMLDRPATFTVYRLDSHSTAPVFSSTTPIPHLREGHSLAMHGDILVVTHPDNEGTPGALLSYRFNDSVGTLEGPLDSRESSFNSLGATKGVTFTEDGRHVLVSFNAPKHLSRTERLVFDLFKARNVFAVSGPRGLTRKLDKVKKQRGKSPRPAPLHNGFALFQIDADGHIAAEPERVVLRKDFCRLENIVMNGGLVAVSDTVNNRVSLFDYHADPDLERPVQSITEGLSMPHGIKLSPDGRLLVVTNYGLCGHNQMIHWGHFTRPRSDSVLVYRQVNTTAAA